MMNLSGLIGAIAIIVFIFAIRTSYAIERATKPRPPGALPRYTNVVASALGMGVAKDDTATQALVNRLRLQLAGVAVLMGGLALVAMVR